MNPHDFVNKWKQSVLKERSAYQSHFIDLCSLINHLSPSDLDPTGSFFTFEAFATKDSGGNGFADVWYKGRFAWEYKGKHANLQEAYQQLCQQENKKSSEQELKKSTLQDFKLSTHLLSEFVKVWRDDKELNEFPIIYQRKGTITVQTKG